MAAWQFGLEAIPRKELIHLLGFTPSKLSLIFEDAEKKSPEEWAIIIDNHDKLRKKCWFLNNHVPSEIIKEIDKYVKRASYGDDLLIWWKTYTSEKDNDAGLVIDADTGKIKEVSFRADLREKELKFLKDMTQLAQMYDWLLVDLKGNVAAPNDDDVKKLMLLSSAYRFLNEIQPSIFCFLPPLGVQPNRYVERLRA